MDLSYLRGYSVNDGKPKSLCSLSYILVDDASDHIIKTGPNMLLAKIDIKNAFQLLLVHPAVRNFLVMEWKNAHISGYLPAIWFVIGTKAVQYSSRNASVDYIIE